MSNLKVTAWLNSPLASEPPMLDSLCEWVMSFHQTAILKSKNGHRHASKITPRGMPVDKPATIPIPIKRFLVPGYEWMIAKCSAPILDETLAEVKENYTKAFPVEEASLLQPKLHTSINVTGGQFKSLRLPLQVRVVEKIVWFCAADEPTRLRTILKKVSHIGKKTSYGYGEVSEWEVELIEEDYSWFAEHEGNRVLMRTLPRLPGFEDGTVGYRVSYGSPIPPYWQRDFYREIMVPC